MTHETQFQHDWFQSNIPNWKVWLADMAGRPGLRALEIGSFEGRSTLWLCENVLTAADARIDCLDLFQPHSEYGDFHARFRLNTAPYSQKIVEHAGMSFDSLRKIEGQFDLVYVDGYHSAFATLSDGAMSWPLLKVGGIMIFDDYQWLPPEVSERKPASLLERLQGTRALRKRLIAQFTTETPKLGIDALLATLAGQYELLGRGYQVAIRKTGAAKVSDLG